MGDHRLGRAQARREIVGGQQAKPHCLEHAIGDAGSRRCLAIGFGIVEDRRPQTVGALAGPQRRDLRLERREQEGAQPVAFGQVEQLDKVRDRHGDPAVTPRPERGGQVVAPVKGPAMEPQPGRPVGEIFHVQHELPLRFLDIGWAAEQQADLGERHHRHHQRVVPELLIVGEVDDDVLETAFVGARQHVHRPFGPFGEQRMPAVVRAPLGKAGKREHRRHGIDRLGDGRLVEAAAEPVLDMAAHQRIAAALVHARQAVQPHALGPVPIVPALDVVAPALDHADQEFAAGILDADQAAHQRRHQRIDLRGAVPRTEALRPVGLCESALSVLHPVLHFRRT